MMLHLPHLSYVTLLSWVGYLCFCVGCTPTQTDGSTSDGSTQQPPQAPLTWEKALAGSSSYLAKYYADSALKWLPSGELLRGKEAILTHYQAQPLAIDSLHVIQTVTAGHTNKYTYEIGELMARDQTYLYLTVTDVEAGDPQHELEVILPYGLSASYEAQVDEKRAEWMKWCHAHEVTQLIEQVYHPEAIYYNHKSPQIGRAAIIETYQYMRNPNYQLTLKPLRFVQVNRNFAFEIGQCSGSYGGKYIMVWQRTAEAGWQVRLDSNI